MTKWPDIPYERFRATGAALHMWAQIVGKCRLANTPWVNHSWHATFYVNARGLTTSLIPDSELQYEVVFDFIDHRLAIFTTDGAQESFSLEAMSVADFYKEVHTALRKLNLNTTISTVPNEVPNPTPFHEQTDVIAYNPEAARDFWGALLSIDRVFKHFRTGYLGKVSPVHLFWGSFDLAVTRFSGRRAPQHPGGIPSLPDTITREAYSHEVSSAGFWPGGSGLDYPAFYSYAYPIPTGFNEAKVEPAEAFFHAELGEFILPYAAVRHADDPDNYLLRFLQSTYDAAAHLGQWDSETLVRDLSAPQQVPLL